LEGKRASPGAIGPGSGQFSDDAFQGMQQVFKPAFSRPWAGDGVAGEHIKRVIGRVESQPPDPGVPALRDLFGMHLAGREEHALASGDETGGAARQFPLAGAFHDQSEFVERMRMLAKPMRRGHRARHDDGQSWMEQGQPRQHETKVFPFDLSMNLKNVQ
jgi:hypothetical protein